MEFVQYHNYSTDLESRLRMDRRRLEEAFLQYALLKVAEWYPLDMSMHKLHLHDGLSQLLLQVTPSFHEAFTKKYSGMYIAIRKKGLGPQLIDYYCRTPMQGYRMW